VKAFLLEGVVKRYRRSFLPDEAAAVHGILPWRILRLTDHQQRPVDGGVVVEEPLEIQLNGQPVAVLMRTPGLEKELAAGFCLGEGLVADLNEIALVRHCGRVLPDNTITDDPLDVSRNQVDVSLISGASVTEDRADELMLIRSGCGRAEGGQLAENLVPIDAPVTVPVDVLRHLPAEIARQQEAYRTAGGIHAAAVFELTGRVVIVCEDIGRHNAVDKALGYCLLRGISLSDKLLVSTGRASYDMVAKGVRLRVPILASISSPTSLAVELAEALNCTLLGYLRGKTLNVYTHSWRVGSA
jgi:FdhD protein